MQSLPRLTCLAVDIGGTFTDLVLDTPSRRYTKKVLSTPSAPERGLMDGALSLLGDAGLSLAAVDVLVHGTTLATNAILERRGAKTALLATQGFRDIIEIGTESRFDQYDLMIEKPRPLVPRALRFGIPERLNSKGEVLQALELAGVTTVVDELKRLEVESVAIAFMHGYLNSSHEVQVADMVRTALPHVSITLASEVCPEIREYERTSTAVANAYVQPQMDRYLGAMTRELQASGFQGLLYLVTSSGSLTTVDIARRFPVRLVESGPAGGAIFAALQARQLSEPKVISFDMGGTTAKVCLIQDGQARKGRLFEVDRTKRFRKGSGLPIRIPVTEMVEIGAGGGSIAKVDAMMRVTIGPESASSEPGPACYARGGDKPTVTDADLVMGLIDPCAFAGGTLTLDAGLAEVALNSFVGAQTGLSAQRSAFAVYEIVCENMASAARAHAVEQGEALRDYTMIAFGGAAPLHAARVAEKIGVQRVLIPPDAGVGSAVGFLAAPLAFELVRSCPMSFAHFAPDRASALLEAMSREAHGIVQPQTHGGSAIETRSAFLRYTGQGNELEIGLPLRPLVPSDAGMLRSAFEAAYTLQFSRIIPGAPLEILNWSVSVSAGSREAQPLHAVEQSESMDHEPGTRRIFDGDAWLEVPVYRRMAMIPGVRYPGPALISELDTTTCVSAAFDAQINATGCIVLNRKPLVLEASHGPTH